MRVRGIHAFCHDKKTSEVSETSEVFLLRIHPLDRPREGDRLADVFEAAHWAGMNFRSIGNRVLDSFLPNTISIQVESYTD